MAGRKRSAIDRLRNANASVAQLAEQRSPKPQVVGSSPTWRANSHGSCPPGERGPPTGHGRTELNELMVEQAEQAVAPADVAKYVLAFALVAGGIVAYYWFGQWPGPLRALLVAAAFVAAGVVVAFTAKGRQGRDFVSESMFELRKVVWPTSQETMRITGVILLVVVIVSLIL